MEIIFLGHSSFRLKGKETTIITDPYSQLSTGEKFPKIEANVVTVSVDQPDYYNSGEVLGSPFLIQRPGEYEIKNASIFGFGSSPKNTSFLFELDGIRLFHLGNLNEKLTDSQVSEAGQVDILFIPVGGQMTLGPKEAVELLGQIDPKIVIPMRYDSDSLAEFLKQKGDGHEVMPKLTVSTLDLPEELKIVVLERKSG